MPRDEALKAITLYPARFLGLGAELGSIEAGKRGDIVVFSGDPLDFSSWIEEVYIDGILAYDKDRDTRLAELMGPLPEPSEDAPADAPTENSDEARDGADEAEAHEERGEPDRGGRDR